MSGELRVCVNIPGIKRAASQVHLWPSRVGKIGGCPCSNLRMLFGLLNMAAMHQCYMPGSQADREVRRQTILLEEALDPCKPLEPPKPCET